MIMTHELKTWTEYFELILSGKKRFEVRKNDRDFKANLDNGKIVNLHAESLQIANEQTTQQCKQ